MKLPDLNAVSFILKYKALFQPAAMLFFWRKEERRCILSAKDVDGDLRDVVIVVRVSRVWGAVVRNHTISTPCPI